MIVACGERAGEVVEVLRTFPHLTDPHTNEPLMNRTVDDLQHLLDACRCTGSFDLHGRDDCRILPADGARRPLLADSTSRWAQAMREMSGRLEEIPGEEAFPAYLARGLLPFTNDRASFMLKQRKAPDR